MLNSKYQKELVRILTLIKDSDLMEEFLNDLLTPAEFEDLIDRWQIVKQLARGTPQREIAKRLNVSVAKITRGSLELRNKHGGFWKMLESINKV